jgi:hypothetical protein
MGQRWWGKGMGEDMRLGLDIKMGMGEVRRLG